MIQHSDLLIGPTIGMIAAVVLDGAAMIPLGAACGVILVIWQMSSRWTKVEDAINILTDRVGKIEEKIDKVDDRFNDFPCPNHNKQTRDQRK